VKEYINLKESNIIYIFAKLPESGIEQD
jgi:hypothetical protein